MTFEESFKLRYGVDPDTYGRDSSLYRTQVSMARWAWNECLRQKGESGASQVIIVKNGDRFDVQSVKTGAVLKRGLAHIDTAKKWAISREFEIMYRAAKQTES